MGGGTRRKTRRQMEHEKENGRIIFLSLNCLSGSSLLKEADFGRIWWREPIYLIYSWRPVDTGGQGGQCPPPIICQTCFWRCYKRSLIWQQFLQQFILAIHAPHSCSAVYGPVQLWNDSMIAQLGIPPAINPCQNYSFYWRRSGHIWTWKGDLDESCETNRISGVLGARLRGGRQLKWHPIRRDF